MNRSLLYGAITLAILLGAVFSRSRTGIGLLILGLLLTSLVLMRNFGKGFGSHITGVVASMGVIAASAIGLTPVLSRFGQDPLHDERWKFFIASLDGIGRFFPVGSGMGTYPEVMRAFYPAGMSGFINHAHNDYIEWLFEGGLIAAALILLFLVLYALRWRAVWAQQNWHTLHMMQVGAGVGLLLIILHGLTDYNLRIPANIIYAALLAGVFFHPGEEEHPRDERRHTRRMEESEVAAPKAVPDADAAATTATGWQTMTVNKPSAKTPAGKTQDPGKARNPFET
jgi:O-antigen ligase